MHKTLVACLLMTLGLTATGEEGSIGFAQKPEVARDGGNVVIAFALTAATDVEVAVLDAQGRVIRHLAAGVLGAKGAPPAPLVKGLAQRIAWDGKDDYGAAVPNVAACSVRVRAGMSAKLEKIVGGDPYAYFSMQMGQGDHAAWRITGLEAKSDGTVYVLGNANNYGPPALRQYDAKGDYQRTVFPPPAGLPLEQVKGWGVNVREDGSYTLQYNDLASPALSNTFMCGTRGRIADLVPSAEPDKLRIMDGYRLLTIHTDGSIPAEQAAEARLVNEPSITEDKKDKKKGFGVIGPQQMAYTSDGKHFYLSGIFAGEFEGWRMDRKGAATTGFWRDGQVFKVEVATRKASPFFALPEEKVIGALAERGQSPIADFKYGTYAALQGVATDAEGRVFVCDRQNKRVLVLDAAGKILREIPVEYPDTVGVSPASKALYVTTRYGHFHGKGKLDLLKFNDWSVDTKPAAHIPLCGVGHFAQRTHLAVAQDQGSVYVWVAYSALPVRVFKDTATGLEPVKDFYEAGPQRALDLQHFIADQKTDAIYVADGFNNCFELTDWSKPEFKQMMISADQKLRALSLAVDPQRRYLYGHADRSPVARYQLDGEFRTPAPPEGAKENAFTPQLTNDWRIGLGQGDRGIAVAPDGSLATMNEIGKAANYGGYLRYFKPGEHEPGLLFKAFEKVRSGGVRFDFQGNLYAAKVDGKPATAPKGFEHDRNFSDSTGKIYKFAPTGSFESGNLFPTEPAAPAKVYDIHYGVISPQFTRTANFGVDGWGRIYYPTSLLPQVSVIDNEGNPILAFGTYGNRDSMGGLQDDLVPTRDIPMAWPNCVDATDEYIYVSDIVNIRLLRLAKRFELSETVKLK